jgi:uncharacterized protein (TIGR02145 family)
MFNQQIQNYKILSPLGQGGMATVYLAEHNLLGNKSAFKLLNKEYVHNENIRKRFLAEARSMARMSHSNIIKVTDLIDDGEMVAFVMEYVEGETLKEYIERKGKLTDEEINSIFSQMVEAVGYVHKQNLVHRDIKPSNFMVDPEGKVKLMDFGIAKTTETTSPEYTQTGTGVQMGTPMYMSPEQVKSTKEVTFASDIYSLGVVLWQMVTGEKPYDTKTLSIPEIQVNIIKEKLPIVNHLWDFIIQKATAKAIEHRYTNSTELLESLGGFDNISIEDETLIEQTGNSIDNYPNVKIGKQVWMTKNLDVDCFRNGDLIFEAKSPEEWGSATANKQPAWCFYKNDSLNGIKYGRIYNWFAVNDKRGLAPVGWHIPDKTDWNILIAYLGGDKIAGKKMKSQTGWQKFMFIKSGNGSNESGFDALPSGERNIYGYCFNKGYYSYWWSSSEDKNFNYCGVNYTDSNVDLMKYNKGGGFSVRCIKD